MKQILDGLVNFGSFEIDRLSKKKNEWLRQQQGPFYTQKILGSLISRQDFDLRVVQPMLRLLEQRRM